ncbi:hypothetical protein Q5752_006629 [Cryptotrichosporon argae]
MPMPMPALAPLRVLSACPAHVLASPSPLAPRWPSAAPPAASAGPSRPRALHASAARRARTDHYASLHLPRNATKQQVKARFYELSKKYHPDAAGGSADKFVTINDAYAILGDDDKRRTYDASLSPAAHARPSAGPHRSWGSRPPPRAPSFARRHAPDLGFGMGMGGSGSGMGPSSSSSSSSSASGAGSGAGAGAGSAFAGSSGHQRTPPLSWGRTHGGYMRKDRAGARDDEVKGESAGWRFVVVLSVITVVVAMGGKLTARADGGDGDAHKDGDGGADGQGRGDTSSCAQGRAR